MSNPRDTHFQQLAGLLLSELAEQAIKWEWQEGDTGDFIRAQERIIAQCAYDLALHTARNIAPVDLERLEMTEVVAKVPDLTQWPEQEN